MARFDLLLIKNEQKYWFLLQFCISMVRRRWKQKSDFYFHSRQSSTWSEIFWLKIKETEKERSKIWIEASEQTIQASQPTKRYLNGDVGEWWWHSKRIHNSQRYQFSLTIESHWNHHPMAEKTTIKFGSAFFLAAFLLCHGDPSLCHHKYKFSLKYGKREREREREWARMSENENEKN